MMVNQFEALLDELHAASLDKGYSAQKPLAKSQTIREVMAKAGMDIDKVKPFTGKPATTDKPVAAAPKEHIALRARAIGEMKKHAQGLELNGPVSEDQLKACHALAAAGEMSHDEVVDVESAMKDARALPTYLLKKLGSGNT
jgi:hypothetical protein